MNLFLSEFNLRAWRLIRNYKLDKAADVTLIYGQKGLGKTAMLHYLYHHQGQYEGGILADALAFAHQYAFAAQDNKLNLFRQRYRKTRLLLLDNLQFLDGKTKTIEELHYTYEYVIGNGGKIVLCLEADLPQLEFLGERLASRFLSGVVIPIARPQANELEQFLAEYIHFNNLCLDSLVLGEVAKRTANLTDALKEIDQFIQFAEIRQDELSLICFQNYCEKENQRIKGEANPLNILRIVAQVMAISVEELLGPSRSPKLNEARQLAIYLIRTLCQISYPAIARYFNRNHNTMIYACQTMQEKLAKDQKLFTLYQELINMFNV